MQSSILGLNGHMMVMLGDAYREFTKGDISCQLKWVNGEPVMILFKFKPGASSPSYMIELRDAHLYMNSDGYASNLLHRKLSMDCAVALGVQNDKASIWRIISLIEDHIEDLIHMPEEPKYSEIANRPIAQDQTNELVIKVNGKAIFEAMV
jgi:hypothetical protein